MNLQSIENLSKIVVFKSSRAEKHLQSRNKDYIVVKNESGITDLILSDHFVTLYFHLDDKPFNFKEKNENIKLVDKKLLKSGVAYVSFDTIITNPPDWELALREFYNSNEAFKFYCDYYYGFEGYNYIDSLLFSGRYIGTYNYLNDFVDWCNGNEYTQRYQGYRKNVQVWYKSAIEIQSYVNKFNISVEDAFCMRYLLNLNPVSGVDTDKLLKVYNLVTTTDIDYYHLKDYKKKLKRCGFI